MEIDINVLTEFEQGLNPVKLSDSPIRAELLGYGEISAIFKLENIPCALKRLPIFDSTNQAKEYLELHDEYCSHLKAAGINLPPWKGYIIEVQNRPVSLYIAQEIHKGENFVHNALGKDKARDLETIGKVISEIEKVWKYNKTKGVNAGIEIAIDGQVSNWTILNGKLFYIDTSTPLLRRNKKEQMDPDLILQSAPSFLRWILKLFFVDDILNRYYIPSQVYTDLVGNLHKEQQPELIPEVIPVVNKFLKDASEYLTEKKIKNYYKEDKLIWTLFLAFRRFDRFITTKILKKRYEFILPGKIKR